MLDRIAILDNYQMARIPTADEIAAAVVAAAREFGVEPERVLDGYGEFVDNHCRRKWGERRVEAKRARMYAAVALHEALPESPRRTIARCLGIRAARNYHKHADQTRERANWWDESAIDRVVLAVRRAGESGRSGDARWTSVPDSR